MNIREMDRQICGNVWTNDAIFTNHRELCLQHRGRFSCSDHAAAAAVFIESKLREYGLENVCRDWFPMTAWKRGSAELELVAPVSGRFPCLALPYAPSCDQAFDLLDLGMGMPSDVEKAGESIRGKAVLVDDSNPPDGPQLHRLQKYLHVLESGAGAFLFVQKTPGMLAPTGSLAFNHQERLDQAIPSIGIAHEVAWELREWAKRGPVRIRLRLDNTLARSTDCNVMGDLAGAGSGDDMILIGGHYDGHDIAQGAADNASGVVVVMEVARLLAPFVSQLRRRIRFVLFGSEEMGLVGSHFYAEKYNDQLHRIRFVFNLDCVGSAGNLSLMLQNAPAWKDVFRQYTDDLPADLVVFDHLVPFSDHFPFLMHGVPSAFCFTQGDGTRGWGHTIADTFEKVSRQTLMRVAMITARLVLRTAMDERVEESGGSADIPGLLAPYHMEKLLRYEGHWHFDK